MAANGKDPYEQMIGIMMGAANDSGTVAASYNTPAKMMQVVPVPSIALQYLINSNGWPLGRRTSSAGEPKTGKSTFAYQLAAWFLEAGGIANIIDTEGKPACDSLESVIRSVNLPRDILENRCRITGATTVEQWQSVVINQAKRLKEAFDKPSDCQMPSLIVLDTLTGVNSKAGSDELVENGGGVAMSRVGQLNAKANYQFFREGEEMSLDKKTGERWPTLFHYVNQEQARGDGFPGKVRAGGVSQDYYTSLDLVFKNGGTSSYNQTSKKTPDCGKVGTIVTIGVRFSTMGPDHKDHTISVPALVEYYIDDDGNKRSCIRFDWYAADTHFLLKNSKKISDVMDIEGKYVRGHGESAKSEALGVSEFIKSREFGMVLQNNQTMMKALRNELGIPERKELVFGPGVPPPKEDPVELPEIDQEPEENE